MPDTEKPRYAVTYNGETRYTDDPEQFENLEGFTIELVGATPGEEPPGIVESAIRSAGQGLYGTGDEIEGVGQATVDWALDPIRAMAVGKKLPEKTWTQRYNESVKKARERNKAAAEANPITTYAFDIGTSMVAPGSRILRGIPIAQATLQGAAHGIGRGEESVGDRIKAGITGGLLGTAGGVVSELATPIMKALGSKAKGLYQKFVPESEEAALIRSRAQKEIGLSPEQQAVKNIEDMVASQKALSGEITTADDLIKEHGEKVARDLKYNVVENVEDGVSNIAVSSDRIMEKANTGLKGGLAERKFTGWFSKLPANTKIKTTEKAFSQSNDLIDKTEGLVDKLIADKGLIERSTGGHAKLIKEAVNKYRERLGEARVGGASPQAMQEVFISMDNLKRQIGKFQNKVKRDAMPREKVEALYEEFKQFLENPNVWGSEMAQAQKEINAAWVRYLAVADAVESTFMRTGKKSTTISESRWGKVSEADVRRIQSVLSDPSNPANKTDLNNLKQWLDATEEITEHLTKYYKPSPELMNEVLSIKQMRKSVIEQIGNARADFARADKVGITTQQKAMENIGIAAQRGLPESENIQAIKKLRAKRSALDYDRGVQSEKEQALRELMEDPSLMRERMDADRAYKRSLETKIGDIKDLYRTPTEQAVVSGGRILRRGIGAAGREALERKAGPIGAVAGKYGKDAWGAAKAMWGERPIKTTDEDIESEIEAIDEEFGLDEKANIKAIQKDKSITQEDKDELYLQRSVNDRKRKPSKTTVL